MSDPLEQGAWVELAAGGPLQGVVVEGARDGLVTIRLVVAESMLTPADPEPDQE